MSITTINDSIFDVSLTTTNIITLNSIVTGGPQQGFFSEFHRVDALMPVTSLLVVIADSPPAPTNTYDYYLTLEDGRTLTQQIHFDAGWAIHPQDSSFFTLPELLANNNLRTACQNMIDSGVTVISITRL